MRRRRGMARWGLALLGVVLFAWWLCYVPRPPGGLYRAVPAASTVVGVHEELGARWDSLMGNPLAGGLLSSVGVDPARLERFSRDPLLGRAVRVLAPEETVWAYLPRRGAFGEPAWLFASWLGGRSQMMRWFYTWFPPAEAVRQPLPGGGSYWLVKTDELPSGVTLAVTFVEGMLLGAVSEDPRSIYSLVETCEGRRPSAFTSGVYDRSAAACAEPAARDHGWVNPGVVTPPESPIPPLLRFAFTRLDERAIEGRVCVPGLLGGPDETGTGPDTEAVARLLGPAAPLAVCVAEPGALLTLLEAATPPVWPRVASEVLARQQAGTAMLAVVDGDYGGRYMGIKTPTLVLGVQVANPGKTLRRVRKALDLLNARYRWGLVPRDMPVGEHPVYVLEPTMNDRDLHLALNERPAYTLLDGWLLLGSNLTGLSRLVAERNGRDERDAGAAPAWRPGGRREDSATAYAWLDLDRGAPTLRAILKVYSLKLLTSKPGASQALRQRLNMISAWTGALQHLEQCRLRLQGDGQASRILFQLGPADE